MLSYEEQLHNMTKSFLYFAKEDILFFNREFQELKLIADSAKSNFIGSISITPGCLSLK